MPQRVYLKEWKDDPLLTTEKNTFLGSLVFPVGSVALLGVLAASVFYFTQVNNNIVIREKRERVREKEGKEREMTEIYKKQG